MPLITGSILDSAGRPANGYTRFRVSAGFPSGDTMTIPVVNTALVVNGVMPDGFTLPPTPEGVSMQVTEDFDGQYTNRRYFSVPAVDEISYANLVLGFEVPPFEIDGGDVVGGAQYVIDGGGA